MKSNIGRKKSEESVNNFIYGQLRPNKVLNVTLLEAFATVKRVTFLPSEYNAFTYIDANLPAERGRFFISPLILARLINIVEIKPDTKCLVIGGLTGYSATLLSYLTTNFFVVEQDQEFFMALQGKFKENRRIHHGLHVNGWQEQAPFDWILIEGGVEVIPPTLFEQLSEGGYLVTVQKKNKLIGRGCIWQKNNGVVAFTNIFDAYVPVLIGFKEKMAFCL